VNAQHAAARAFTWAGSVLFAAALAYFLFSYAVTFGEITAGEVTTGAIAIDLTLFSAFALHHSVFARTPVRAFVRRFAPEPLERSVYVWIASLMLIGVCYSWRPIPGVAWRVPSPWSWLLVVMLMGAIWWTLRSAVVIDAFELAGIRQSKASEFKTDGPYGWVRHPIYLGWIVMVFAAGTMTMTRLVFAVVSSVYLVIAIPFEERTILRSASAYGEYARRVPWKLIPRIY
jgi:protein-S-isoprenylcysteine O-methyltransferase Ste14